MTPEEQRDLITLLDRLTEAAEEFRASREAMRTALVALVEANEAQARSIDKVIEAYRIALRVLQGRQG